MFHFFIIWSYSKEAEHLQNMFITHYTYTFQVYHFEKHHNIYLPLLKEIMFPYGIGFSSTDQKKIFQKKRIRVSKFIVDETLVKAGNEYIWLWIAIEPIDKIILGIRISIERNMLVAEQFLQNLIRKYGKHRLSTDGGTWYP
jgi:DDE domain